MLKRVEYGFPEILRERLAEGRPSQAILEDWAALAWALDREPEALTAALREAAQCAPARGAATVAPRSAIGVAIIEPNGELALADELFSKWFGGQPDLSAFRRLSRLALRDGHASGLVEAADGAALAACAGLKDAAAGWPLPPACRAAAPPAVGRAGEACPRPAVAALGQACTPSGHARHPAACQPAVSRPCPPQAALV